MKKQPTKDEMQQFMADNLEEQTKRFFKTHVKLPPVPERIKTTAIGKMGLGEHEAVAVFSDYHLGSKIDVRVTGGLAEYNPQIARHRLAEWRNGVLRFTQMTQALAPVNTLHIFALGDDLEGHGEMFGTQKFEIDDSIYFQYMAFIQDMCEILPQFLTRYKKVIIHKVHGNHGRVAASAKQAYPPDNFELMAWQNIKDRMMALAPGRFEFNISTSFFIMLEILGWSFYIRHGHKIGGLKSTYTGAQDNKFRMNSIVGEVINYMVKAHLHEAGSQEAEIQGQVIQNGCFVGPSLLSVEGNRAAANLPSQELFFVNRKRGITHHHRIYLATVDEVRQIKVWGRKK